MTDPIHIGCRLAEMILKSNTVQIRNRVFWSDSMNVLSYIRSDARRYVQFVAFRVGEILESTEVKEWRYVPTKENVADEATKWTEVPVLTSTSRWFVGPNFLYSSDQNWPKEKPKMGDIELELRRQFHHQEMLLANATPDVTRINRWWVLVRAQALVLRIMKWKDGIKGVITASELRRAEEELFRTIQMESYPNEFLHLKKTPLKTVDKSSRIYKFSPYLDGRYVICMRGRISRVDGVQDESIDPIILPSEHPITRLLMLWYHRRYHHQNNETVVNEIRQRFWIPKLRAALKKVTRDCQRCKNDRARPLMADTDDGSSTESTSCFFHQTVYLCWC